MFHILLLQQSVKIFVAKNSAPAQVRGEGPITKDWCIKDETSPKVCYLGKIHNFIIIALD